MASPASKQVKPIPEGYQAVIPYLAVKDAPKLIAFLKEAFGAKELSLLKKPDGSVANAELKVYDSVVMVAEARSADATSAASLYVYVSNADLVYEAALKAGATSLMKPADMFYGDRNAGMQITAHNQKTSKY